LLSHETRLDGRKPLDYRGPIEVTYGVVKTAEGSAKVKIGDTEVIAGVKLEIGEPYADTPDEGTIIVGAELIPMSNPEYELGPPGLPAIELARVVDRGIRESKAIDFKKLCIAPSEKIWMVIIDIVPINDAGNLFDASSLAALAALQDAKYPSVEGDKIDYKKKTDKRLPLQKLPINVTVIKIGNKFIVDPDIEEEKAIDARLTVASIEDGTLCALQKGGEQPLSVHDIEQMLDIGIQKGKELRKHLKH
jgi:exosome complex component RRP42